MINKIKQFFIDLNKPIKVYSLCRNIYEIANALHNKQDDNVLIEVKPDLTYKIKFSDGRLLFINEDVRNTIPVYIVNYCFDDYTNYRFICTPASVIDLNLYYGNTAYYIIDTLEGILNSLQSYKREVECALEQKKRKKLFLQKQVKILENVI